MKPLFAALGLLALASAAATAAPAAGPLGRATAAARQAALCGDTGHGRPSCAPPAWTLTGNGAGVDPSSFEP